MIVSPKEGTTTDQSDQSIDVLGEKVINGHSNKKYKKRNRKFGC